MAGLADLFLASSREEEAAKKGPPPVEVVKMDEFDLVTIKAVDSAMQSYSDDVMRALETMVGRLEGMERKVSRLGRTVVELQQTADSHESEKLQRLKDLTIESQSVVEGIQQLREQHEQLMLGDMKLELLQKKTRKKAPSAPPPADVKPEPAAPIQE
eukprot:CAMPEP_0118926916 /NCGR_PEP_ID=MMETSP1169-20130426/4517_1 /TAXON_ID=36882 /ORGANISM="Pyramimonas obovata, Strain CCMP722" /LENGTH=156 /DNA_ID=CAMNT_0006868573 /DNA_START=105 /DNA_END=572 /DNA_ORIENTATION=-